MSRFGLRAFSAAAAALLALVVVRWTPVQATATTNRDGVFSVVEALTGPCGAELDERLAEPRYVALRTRKGGMDGVGCDSKTACRAWLDGGSAPQDPTPAANVGALELLQGPWAVGVAHEGRARAAAEVTYEDASGRCHVWRTVTEFHQDDASLVIERRASAASSELGTECAQLRPQCYRRVRVVLPPTPLAPD